MAILTPPATTVVSRIRSRPPSNRLTRLVPVVLSSSAMPVVAGDMVVRLPWITRRPLSLADEIRLLNPKVERGLAERQ